MEATTASKTWTFPSSSSSAIYTTTQRDDGALSCTCNGWKFKRGDGPRSCTHTRKVEALLGATPAPTVKTTPTAPKVAPVKSGAVVIPFPTKAPAPLRAIPAPMLASAMTVPLSGAAFDAAYAGWAMEEKHDGHRVGVVVAGEQVSAWSRPGHGEEAKPRDLPDTIKAAMRHLAPGVYDGELVSPGGNSWDVTVIGARLMFVAFDVVELDGRDMMAQSYEIRRAALIEELRKLPDDQTAVTTTRSLPATWATVQAIWARGGEGAILKRTASRYRPGHRSPEWVKVKEKRAATLTCYGFEAGKMGPYSKLQLRDDAGIETTAKTLGNDLLRAFAKDPQAYIGRRVVISYQQKTPSGKYRHGIFDHFAGEGE